MLTYAVPASAHCDSMDGPVVTAARRALDSGRIEQVLIWVPDSAEEELRTLFATTLNVRGYGEDARQVADRLFFETVVRLHREGEGEPFTGLKPAGTEQSPIIALADRAVEDHRLTPLSERLTAAVEGGLAERFAHLEDLSDYDRSDVAAGRAWVEAYVTFVHFAEGIHGVIAGSGHSSDHHDSEPPASY
jgi:hypothetical protein